MFITNFDAENDLAFDWKTYFSNIGKHDEEAIVKNLNTSKVIGNARKHLRENQFHMTLTLTRVMRKLLQSCKINENPAILELGAGTGFVTKWLIQQYGGSGVLVDNNPTSYEYYQSQAFNDYKNLEYIPKDIFELELPKKFDVVCSFGLLEHFQDKKEVLSVHRKFLKDDGIILILVPLDSVLNRVYWELHPELNLGYRELLTETEFRNCLKAESLTILSTEISQGYCFDFIAGACRIANT